MPITIPAGARKFPFRAVAGLTFTLLVASACTQAPTTAPAVSSPTIAAPSPTVEPPTLEPEPTLEATTTVEPTAAQLETALIYLVALEDNGQSGKLVGCGDSLVGMEVELPPGEDTLKAALTALFAIKDQMASESGLYNALYQSNLAVESIAIDASGIATVQIKGETALGGVCDNPRFEGQILETILQFPEVTQASVYINGVPLADFVSGR